MRSSSLALFDVFAVLVLRQVLYFPHALNQIPISFQMKESNSRLHVDERCIYYVYDDVLFG